MRSPTGAGHLDEVYVRINGVQHYLWRAVDHEGEVLESFVTKERDKAAALKFIKKALKRHGSPKAITTDGLRSYGAAMKEIGKRREAGGGPLGPTTELRTATSPFDEGSGRWPASAACTHCRSSAPCTPPSTTTSLRRRHLTGRDQFKANRSAALAEWQTLAA